MNNDREISYLAGELTDAELLAFEQSLSDSARKEASALKSAFAGLKELNSNNPEPQISFDRIRHAIESTPATSAPIWQRWFVWAAPVTAMCAIAIVMTRSNAPTMNPEVGVQPNAVAKDTQANPGPTTTEATKEVVAPAPIPKPTAVVAKVEPEKRSPKRSYRRRPILIADNRSNFPRPSQGFSKAPPAPVNPGSATVDSMPTPPVADAVEMNQEPVVVVSPTTSAKTGANSAMEVSKQGDDVLGG